MCFYFTNNNSSHHAPNSIACAVVPFLILHVDAHMWVLPVVDLLLFVQWLNDVYFQNIQTTLAIKCKHLEWMFSYLVGCQ